MPMLLPSVLLAVSALVIAAPADVAAQDAWPKEPITIVVGAAPGGGHDRLGRGLAPFLAKELGVPVTVINKPGGSTRLSVEFFLQQPQDGNSILVAAPAPFWVAHIEREKVKYRLDDFIVLNVQWPDYSGFFLRKDLPHKDARELFEDIRRNPRKLSVGTISNSTEAINLYLTLEALKIPPANLRIVEYDNNAPLRAAIVGGQVDMALSPLESSGPIISSVRPFAVYNDERSDQYPDIPTMNEQLKSFAVTLPVVPSSIRGFLVSRTFKEKHPDRFGKLLKAYEKIVKSAEFKAAMEKSKIGADWMGEKSQAFVKNGYDGLVKYQPLLEKYR